MWERLSGRIASYSAATPALDHVGLWFQRRLRRPSWKSLSEAFSQALGSSYMMAFQVPLLPHHCGTLIFTGATASSRGRAKFGGFAAAKAGLRACSGHGARVRAQKGILVAHVVVDGVVDGERANQFRYGLGKAYLITKGGGRQPQVGRGGQSLLAAACTAPLCLDARAGPAPVQGGTLMSNSLTLHQWEISPFCQKVARSLRHKGLAYETINYNGLLAAKVGKLSKVGKLPVLEAGGERIQDSTRIARWLDEHHPQAPLYPADQQQRALAELWEDWADELLYWYEVYFRANDPDALDQAVRISTEGRSTAERLPLKLILRTALRHQLKGQGLGRMARADVEAEFLRHLDRIETVLQRSDWLVGEARTIADIAVGSQLLEVQRTSARMRPQLQSRPRLSDWLARI